jgi:hypothetical protein
LIDACGLALVAVGVLAVSGRGNDDNVVEPGNLTDRTGDFVPVHAGQSNVEHDDIGLECGGTGHRLLSVQRQALRCCLPIRARAGASPRINVVLHDEAAERTGGQGRCATSGAQIHGLLEHERWQRDREATAPSRPLASCVHAATMELGDSSHERQPQAEASLRTVECPVVLREQVEYFRQQLR